MSSRNCVIGRSVCPCVPLFCEMDSRQAPPTHLLAEQLRLSCPYILIVPLLTRGRGQTNHSWLMIS